MPLDQQKDSRQLCLGPGSMEGSSDAGAEQRALDGEPQGTSSQDSGLNSAGCPEGMVPLQTVVNLRNTLLKMGDQVRHLQQRNLALARVTSYSDSLKMATQGLVSAVRHNRPYGEALSATLKSIDRYEQALFVLLGVNKC